MVDKKIETKQKLFSLPHVGVLNRLSQAAPSIILMMMQSFTSALPMSTFLKKNITLLWVLIMLSGLVFHKQSVKIRPH